MYSCTYTCQVLVRSSAFVSAGNACYFKQLECQPVGVQATCHMVTGHAQHSQHLSCASEQLFLTLTAGVMHAEISIRQSANNVCYSGCGSVAVRIKCRLT